MSNRMPQINEKIQKTLAQLFSEEIEIPLEYFISVVKVDCAPDLRNAKVYVSILPNDKEEDGLKFLIDNRKEIQKVFGNKINIKYTPILKFIIDKTEQSAQEIYSILDNLD